MISEGNGMQADSIAISSSTPGYPVVLITVIMNAASAEITREIKRKSLSVLVQSVYRRRFTTEAQRPT